MCFRFDDIYIYRNVPKNEISNSRKHIYSKRTRKLLLLISLNSSWKNVSFDSSKTIVYSAAIDVMLIRSRLIYS